MDSPLAILLGVNRSLLMPVTRDAVDSRP